MQCIQVSVGELLDKYSILKIKATYITDPIKLKYITDEINVLQNAPSIIQKCKYLYELLLYINKRIWNFTNAIRSLTVADNEYMHITASIFDYNDRRFRIKNIINTTQQSIVCEQKNFESRVLCITIESREILYEYIHVINYLVCVYDQIQVYTPCFVDVHRIFNYDCILESSSPGISISTLSIPSTEDNEVYNFKPLVYISNGRLGDFIQQLGIVYDKYIQTGRKGIVYLRDKDWSLSITRTFNDTRDVILKQDYISGYSIHNGEKYDIDLSIWRKSPLVYKASWYDIFKSEYSVDWCVQKYMHMTHVNMYADKILFHTSIERFNTRVNYSELFSKYGTPIFVTTTQTEPDYFLKKTGIHLDTIIFASLYDFYAAIYTCKFYIGNMSSPTAFAQACFKDRIVLLGSHAGENCELTGMKKYWPNCTFLEQYS